MYLPNEILQVCFDIHEKVKTPSEGQEEILRLFDVGQGEQLLFSPDDIERIIDEKSQFSGMQFRRYFEEK